jgi:hypothetical protein
MSASTAANPSPDPRTSTVRLDSNQGSTPRLGAALNRIAQFADLKTDWDSYGGDPPSSVARAEAGRWVEIVADLFGARAGDTAIPYSVAPLADGGIQLEWRGRNGVVELEVGPEGELGYLFLLDDQTEEGDDATWSDVLRRLLRALV